MHTTTMLEHDLDAHLLRILAVVSPDRVRSEKPADDAPIRLLRLGTNPRLPAARPVTRQVRHLHSLGLVERDGHGWSRTDAGNDYLTRHGGAS